MKPKHEKFVQSYLETSNATRAVIAAGYACENPRSQGSRLLARSDIRAEIDRRQKISAEAAGMNAVEVLSGIADLALNSKSESIRLRAYELLGKRLNLWDEKPLALKNTEPVVNIIIKEEAGKKAF